MDKKNGWDYSKVTEEDIERAEKGIIYIDEKAKEENNYDIMGLLKEIVEKDKKVGEK